MTGQQHVRDLPTYAQNAAAKLRDVQAITDAALSGLDEHAFLSELLTRVKDVFQADTAAVLLLDSSSGHLIATAASGLEEEVRQGVRLPLGRGFAGRIASGRRPVILDRVDHSHVLNPILLVKGIRSLMGVPMVAGGTVIGVLHVGSLTPRHFTRADAELLQLAADRAATVVRSVQARADRAAAAALARSLAPSRLPALPGVEMAARYVPGDGDVGGDWYDVFTLPSGELGVVMGDVAGTGLRAAVVMGRMRSALRAYALESSDPADVLKRLDRKMQHFELGALATVVYAVFEPGLGRMHLSSAGHFAPVIAYGGQPAMPAPIATDLLIGMDSSQPRRVTTVPVSPGALLCFFTDGLVERRGRSLDDGLARLCGALVPEPPDDACASVMQAMIGGDVVRDDVTLLMVRRLPADATSGG